MSSEGRESDQRMLRHGWSLTEGQELLRHSPGAFTFICKSFKCTRFLNSASSLQSLTTSVLDTSVAMTHGRASSVL